MAEVDINDADEAWKAFKLHLKSSKMADKKGGANMIARKFIADQKSQIGTAASSSGSNNVNLKDDAFLNSNQQGAQSDKPNTRKRRVSLRTTGAGTGLANHLAKRFGSTPVDDDCKSAVSMSATVQSTSPTRSLSPMREGRRFSLMGMRDPARENNRLLTPPRRI
jgi:hypothetical protein